MINEWLEFNLKPLLVSIESLLSTAVALLAADGDNILLATGTTGAIATSTETTAVTYTNSTGSAQRANFIMASGQSSACFRVKIDGVDQTRKLRISPTVRTLLLGPKLALTIPAGSTIIVTAEHEQTSAQTFTASIIGR